MSQLRDTAIAAYNKDQQQIIYLAAKAQVSAGHQLTSLLSTILGQAFKTPLETGTTIIDGIEFQAKQTGQDGDWHLYARLVKVDGTALQHTSDQYRIDSPRDLGALIETGEV